MSKTIDLIPEETRSIVEGIAVITPNDNQPWKKVTPEALSSTSLLNSVEGINPLYIEEKIMKEISIKLFKSLPFNIQPKEGHYDIKIADIVQDKDHLIKAILQWRFDYYRITGHGGSGEQWMEGRCQVELDSETAKQFIKDFENRTAETKKEILERRAYDEALKEAGLDEETIREKQNACLKNAGLDPETIYRKKHQFDADYRAKENK